MTKPILTPERLDAIPSRVTPVTSRDGNVTPRIIWTLPAIGQRIGVGVDFVRDTLAKQPGTPVKEIGGRYYAFEDELIGYLRKRA